MIEVRYSGKWQPGQLVSRRDDGWCRVVVAGREMTFSPYEVRTAPSPARMLALADDNDLLDGSLINESALRAILSIAIDAMGSMTPADLEALDLPDPYRLILIEDARRLVRATGGTA